MSLKKSCDKAKPKYGKNRLKAKDHTSWFATSSRKNQRNYSELFYASYLNS